MAPVLPPTIDLLVFSGLAGDVVRFLRPHTEAADAGLLLDFLTSFGNAIGLAPYFVADGALHRPRLNVLLCGTTARSRKGTAQRATRYVLRGSSLVSGKSPVRLVLG
jgi:hypothetical protein